MHGEWENIRVLILGGKTFLFRIKGINHPKINVLLFFLFVCCRMFTQLSFLDDVAL